MGFLCKKINEKTEVTWEYIKDAYVAAITVCNQKLNPTLIPSRTPSNKSIVVMGAIDLDWVQDVQNKLISTDFFDKVDILDVLNSTPTLEQLKKYDAALVFSDELFDDAVALGDILADYVDSGYGVVSAVFENNDFCYLQGRWYEENYDPIAPHDQREGTELTLGTIILPNHPVISGVESFNGGESSFYGDGDLTNNAIEIAQWSNGATLIAEKLGLNAKVIMLNFYPVSRTIRNDFWRTETDGALLMGNALKYVM